MPDYAIEKAKAIDFLQNFTDPLDPEKQFKYIDILQDIANRDRKTLDISLDDIEMYQHDDEFLENIAANTKRYLKIFAEAADELMPNATKPFLDDVFDVLIKERRRALENRESAAAEDAALPDELVQRLPAALTRRYEVFISPRSHTKPLKMRHISAQQMGHLVAVRGIVTNVTDVKPLIVVATYLDEFSGYEIYQEVNGRTFNPIMEAPKEISRMNGKSSSLFLQSRGSKFIKFQEVRLQELADEVPQGSTPRTILVHLAGELTRSCKPGDAVTVAGIFLPEPFTGFKAMKAGLMTSTYLHGQTVRHEKRSYSELLISEEQRAIIESLGEEGDIYNRLARSIAPNIWGHEDVKKALLLAMVGGVTKTLPDGMKLRGDIHLCLMGDPGLAKSQLLRYVCNVSPRAIYTTGKGSSGVGLTAAITRDHMTGEMMLEGGALVLADKGICCIDEFDKMDEIDRTSIHEVMEQQTVSIAKAGITTTLNTRTTVLAAANPAWGRYDVRRSPAENINLPAALLSRFDLLWLILDRVDDQADRALAAHVLQVHRDGRAPQAEGLGSLLPAETLRAYIAEAKQHEPCIPEDLTEYVAAVYAEIRADEAASDMPHSYTTARTLLSILRISQALARLRLDDTVAQSDVDEALRLMKMSKISLTDDDGPSHGQDRVSAIYSRIRDASVRQDQREFTWADIQALFTGTDFSLEEINACIDEYESIEVWSKSLDASGNPMITFTHEDNDQER